LRRALVALLSADSADYADVDSTGALPSRAAASRPSPVEPRPVSARSMSDHSLFPD
jgi:hypothetical protein